jgi:DNA repair exonuclease SbcCD ATPase subunit
MSDKTFGVKVSEELYEKVKNMIDVSGGSSKEWFEKAVALTAIQNLKDGSGDYRQDLSELELHTTRMYELVANMIQRANYLKDDAVRELNEKLASRDITIAELQNNVKGLKEQLDSAEEGFKQTADEKTELNEQLEQMRAANTNNQDLIKEYKEKVDTLSSLVNEYKGYAVENLELKQAHAAEKEQMKAEYVEKESRMVSSIEELKTTVRDQAGTIEQYQLRIEKVITERNDLIEENKVNLKNQLTQLTERKDLEKERAILEIERKYQAKLEQAHEQYNEKLAGLYERLETKDRPKKRGQQEQ